MSQLTRYHEIGSIGAGGMGMVTLAEDTVLRRRVALKRVSAGGDDRAAQRLRREALVGARLSHPNLVAVYDVQITEGDVVVVMEYVEGQTLREVLSQGPLTPARAVEVIDAVAGALDHIHSQGVVHRDVKPANILLGHHGEIKLADLGVATVEDRTRLTTTGMVVGTFSYMALEQLEGQPPTPAVDVYALAAVGYETLSGVKARPQTNPVALAHAIATEPPPDLRQVWGRAPAEAVSILCRGMAADPSRRPRSASELAGRLRSAVVRADTVPTPPVRRPAPLAPAAPAAVLSATAPASGLAGHPAHVSPTPPPARARTSSRPGPRPTAGPVERDRRLTRRRRGPLAGAALALLALAAVLVILNSGATGPPHAPAARPASHLRAPHSPPRASGGSAGAGVSATSAADPRTPAGAVQAFYLRAAAHQYQSAWSLATPAFRTQLQGFDAFRAQQGQVRSLTFTRAAVVGLGAGRATVAIQTVPVLGDGTHHCRGTVEVLQSPGGTWAVDHIAIEAC